MLVFSSSRPAIRGAACVFRALLVVLFAAVVPAAGAQGPSSDWLVSVTVAPNPSAFIADWERNPGTVLLNVVYAGRGGSDVHIEAFARSARGEIGRVRSPLLAFAGGPATQVFTALEVADWDEVSSDRAVVDVVRRTGVLPEGRYELCARVLTAQGTQLAQACTPFDVALPEPPQLLYPNNGGTINARMPVFQWSGVSALPGLGLRYRVRVAERLDGQQPEVALAASQPHFEGEATAPLLVYPVDALPLRAGREYAWQVEAIDDEGRAMTRGGKKSEIWTFRATDAVGGPVAELPDVMELVPGAVRVGGFRAARVKEDEHTYTVNGRLRLELLVPFPGTVDVEASDLVIDRGALPQMRVLSGTMRGTLPTDLVPAAFAGEGVTFKDLAFDTRQGITLGAEFSLPGSTPRAFPQRARLGELGLFGTLTMSGQLLLAGTSPVRLNVSRVTARYPYATVDLEGGLEIFGRDARCTISFGVPAANGTVPVAPRCLAVTEIPLAGGDQGLKMVVRNLAGSLTLDPAKKSVAHELTGMATLAVSDGASCKAAFTLGLTNGAVTLGDSTTRCDAGEGKVKMGWLSGKTSSLAVQRFAWDSTRKSFDFALTMDVQPTIGRTEGFPLPAFVGVRLGPDGVRFPAIDTTVTVGKAVDFQLYDMMPERVRIAETLVPWNVWLVNKEGSGGEGAGIGERLAYDVTGKLTLDPWLPGIKIPACITSQQIDIVRGRLSAVETRFTIAETTYPAGCELRVSPSNSFSFELTRVAGEIVQPVRRADDAERGVEARANQDADIYGAFILPEAFACAKTGKPHKLPITRPLRFGRNGITGVISGFSPGCPIELPLVTIEPGEGTLTLAVRDSAQAATLDLSASATFALAATPTRGRGSLTIDLIAGRVTKSDIDFPGPFRLDLPREQPVLSFEIAGAKLDTAGLYIDGRNKLTLGSGQVVQTTFDRVRLNPATASISSGRVLFDLPFALEAVVSDSAAPRWGAVPTGSPLRFATGVRIDLPAQIALDSAGFTARGDARGQVRFGGRDLDSLTLAFTDDLALSLAPFAVRAGSIDFNLGGLRVAVIDRLGFHPDVGYFAQRLIPARLPLPDTTVAYAQLRDADGRLLVTADTTEQGVRLRTRPGQTIAIAFPALTLGRPAEPRVEAALDVTIDRGSGAVIAGAVHARIPDGDRSTFDLLEHGLPVAFDTVAYEKRGAEPFQFHLGGRLRLLGGSQAQPGSVQLALGGDGRLAGAVRVVAGQDTMAAPLHTDKLRYAIDSIVGRIDANLRTGALKYDLALGGAIGLALGEGRTYSVPARIRATEHLVEVTDIRPATTDTANYIGFDAFRLRLQNLRVPRLQYSHATRHLDFELLFDVAFEFPQFDALALPVLRDVSLREDGFTFPAYTIPALTAASVEWDGFLIRPLAFRMPRMQYAWFSDQPIRDWGFRFDLEVGFTRWPEGAPDFVRNAKLSILDAGISNGFLVGRIEQREIEQAIEIGEEVTVQVKKVWGVLSDPTVRDSIVTAIGDSAEAEARETLARLKKSKLDLYVEGEFSLGRHGQCANAANPEAFQVAGASLRLRGNGGLTGRLENFVPKCPIAMGDIVVTPGRSTLGIGVPFDSTGVRLADSQAWLRTEASVAMPGPQEGSTVSARGMIALELTEPRILDGYVSLAEPFRVALPREKPVFTFVASRGRLDARGLRVTGEGQLALDEGRSVGVSFADLTIDPRSFRVTGGSASFLGKFALASSVSEAGTLEWTATDSTAATPPGAGFRITLPDTLTLSPAGLSIAGRAGASLTYGDSSFASLTANFRDGFTLDLNGTGTVPVRIARGRAELIAGDTLPTLVAHLDSLGFWPGNVFGVLPIPGKLGLTDTTVAYLRLRDDSGQLLIESSSTREGIRLTTGLAQVELVVPALAAEGELPPSVGVMFDVTVNPRTLRVVSGEIVANASDEAEVLLSLRNLGIPLDVRRLAYAARGLEGYALRLDGRVVLPGALDSLDLRFRDLAVAKGGVTGTAEVGALAERWSSELAVVAEATLRAQSTDTLTMQVVGARAIFDGPRSQVQLAGAIRSSLFATRDSGYVPLFFTGTATTAGVTLGVDPAKGTGKPLPISLATFEPQAIGGHTPIEVTATADELTLRLSGTIRVPSLGERFAITVPGLRIGTRGIELPQVSLRGADRQTLALFGAQFTLRDSLDAGGVPVYPAVALARQDGVVSLTMSGDVTMLGNTARFYGLRVSSDGRVALAGANLISQPLDIVQGRLVLDTLAIRENALHASAVVTLPAPFSGGEMGQRASFSIAADGSMTGGGRFTLISETDNLATARAKVDLPMATAHLRHLGLTLDLASRERSALEIVGDLYVQGEQSNRIRIGSTAGGHVQPGLRFGFDGSTALGPITMADTIAVDFEVVRLAVANVAATGTADAFSLAFAGRLSLTLPSVSGGVSFADVKLTSGGSVELKDASVHGGEFEIAQVIRLDLSGFQYSDTPTTIRVAGGALPFGGAAPTADSVTVAVTSFARFGGTIDVKGALTGGVKEVLFYKTAEGETQMVIKQAVMNIYDVVDLTGDFLYRQKGSDFEMLLGARGTVMDGPGMMFVGLVAQEQATTRIGIFAAATGLTLPITPMVTVTDIGAGFFLNPKPEYVDYVRNFTGLAGSAQGKVRPGPADRFAVMLYGGAEVTPAKVAKGRVLITVTPTVFMLDGDVTVLDQGDSFRGSAHLAVGLKRPFAEGNISLNVDYGDVITGHGGLEFFVYENAWGIRGRTDVKLVKLVEGKGTLFIGSPGFLVAASIKVPSLWIISIKRAEAMAFYRTEGNEWGALAAIGVEVAVIPDVLAVEGTLEGALIRPAGQMPFLYVVAELEAHAVVASWKGSVWAKVGPGGADAGFGRDAQMEQVIARATGMGEQMEEARAESQAAIAEARSNVGPELPIALTEAELVGAYNRIQGWTPDKFEIARALSVDAVETQTFPQTGEQDYFNWYLGVLRQQGAPADTAIIRQYRDSVNTQVNVIAGRKASVDARIRELRARIGGLTAAASSLAPAMPGIDTSFALVTREEIRGDDTVKVATVAPSFAIDGAALAAQRTALEEHSAATERMDAEIRQRLKEMEDGLTSLRRVTSAQDDGSLLSYARMHGAVLSAAERQHALHANQILRKQEWMRTKLGELGQRQPTIEAILTGKSSALRAAYGDCDAVIVRVGSSSGSERGGSKYDDIEDNREARERERACREANAPGLFAERRAKALQAWAGGSVLTSYQAAAAGRKQWDGWFSDQALSYGRDLWYNLAHTGMTASIAAADAELTTLQDRSATQLAGLRDAHGALSSSLARLYADQAEMTGLLFDAYDRYLYSKSTAGSVPQELAQYATRREQLRAELTVPRVSDVRVSQSHDGFMTTTAFSWSGWHPSGVYEFAFRDETGADAALGGQLYSVGGADGYTSVRTSRPGGNTARTLQVSARGGAGYAGFGRARYELRAPAPASAPRATVSTLSGDASAPTTPVVEIADLQPTLGADGRSTIWLRSASPVTVRFSAVDVETGVAGYQYAVGTSPGAADITGWTSVGGRQQAVIHELRPPTGGSAYVSVRATNGAGMTSTIGTSPALRIDETAPTFAAGSTTVAPPASGAAAEFVGLSITGCSVQATPSGPWQGQLGGTTAAALPALEMQRPTATDGESGVRAYYYAVDTVARTSFDGTDWTQVDGATLRIEGAPFTFGRAYVVSIVAVNQSGRASAPHVIGPFVPADPTAPTPFSVCAGQSTTSDRIMISVLSAAHDPESGIVGYEYRIRTSARVVRDWPGTGPDFGALPTGTTVATESLFLPVGTEYWVDVRAVNGQGRRSGIVRVGPLTMQRAAPSFAADAASY